MEGPGRPRLGLIGVVPEIEAEADTANEPSIRLLDSLGARRTGGAVELVRRHQQ